MFPKSLILFISCEHGGNQIPDDYRYLFKGAEQVLNSHRGYDIGALGIALQLAAYFAAPSVIATTSRLLIDLNRSLHHRHLFSDFTCKLDRVDKQSIIKHYYQPHRKNVYQRLKQLIAEKSQVLHIAVHSFTPVLDGVQRNADIGYLYDPGRIYESETVNILISELGRLLPGWRIRRNYPYRGTADGLTASNRKVFAEDRYIGLELEVNQNKLLTGSHSLLETALAASLSQVLS